MSTYYIITQEEELIKEFVGEDVDCYTYYDRIAEFIDAPTRGKARALFCKLNDLEFTTPLFIRKLKRGNANFYYEHGLNKDEVRGIEQVGLDKMAPWGAYAVEQFKEKI